MYNPITGTGDGSAPVVDLTFPYLSEDHVKASVNGADVTFTWTGLSQITFDAPVASGSSWEVYRDTSLDASLVDFTDGAALTEEDLDKAKSQQQYLDQEISARVTIAQADADAATSAAASASSALTAIQGTLATLPDDTIINPTLFGVIEGDNAANANPNSAAFTALLTAIAGSKKFNIKLPLGTYWFSETLDLNVGNLILEGSGGAGVEDPNTPIASTLKFTEGNTGIRVHGPNTSGADVKDAVAHSSGLGTVLRNLVIVGSFSGTEGEAHGIQLRWPATIENVTIRDFEGDGIHIAADGLAATGANPPYGNANRSSIIRVSVYNCRDGLFFDGGDANACVVVMADVNACRRWGINDSSGLGNSFFGGQLSTNGSSFWNDGTAGHPAAMVSQAGNRYGAIIGQEAWCSTNAPSGTTADNQGWYYIGAGAPDVGIPAWVSGMDVRAGGHAHDDSAAATSYYSGIYAEGGYAKAQLTNPSIVVGGKLAEALFQNNASPATGQVSYAKGATYGPASSGITYEIGPSLQVKSGAVYSALGAPQGNPENIGLNLFHPTYGQFGYRLFFDSAHDGDLSFGYNGSIPAFRVTSPTTTQQFGTGVVQPDVFSPASLAVAGNFKDYTAAKRLMIDFQAPTSGDHSQGEWAFYWGGLTDFIGWHCVTSGTPGDWRGVWGLTAAKPGGWTAWTGVGSKATKDVSTATTADVAAGLKSLIDDLMARGVI